MLTAELEMSSFSFQKSSHLAKTPHTNPSHCFFLWRYTPTHTQSNVYTHVQIHADNCRSPDVFNQQRGPTLADKRLVTCLLRAVGKAESPQQMALSVLGKPATSAAVFGLTAYK